MIHLSNQLRMKARTMRFYNSQLNGLIKPSGENSCRNYSLMLTLIVFYLVVCSCNLINCFHDSDLTKKSVSSNHALVQQPLIDPLYKDDDEAENKAKINDVELENWVKLQVDRSWSALLNNISPRGALPGLVVASLSTYEPDYFYTWTRDTAIILREVVTRYEETNDSNLLRLIKQSISTTKVIQNYDRKYSSVGLGEPKNYVNGYPFTKPWGRPQMDGPGLRAILYIKFANIYLQRGGYEAKEYIRDVLYDGRANSRSVIKADLEYISNNWNGLSFDLWEEVKGHHFFTLIVIQSALKDGVKISKTLNDPGATSYYKLQSELIEDKLKLFWNQKLGYIRATVNYTANNGKTTWLDMGTILGSLLSGERASAEFRPNSTKIVSTYKAFLASMNDLYPINQRYHNITAKPVGRYPEDIYDGVSTSQGNPWFISIFGLSEFLFRNKEKKVSEQFLRIGRNYIKPNGSIHEQIHRSLGIGIGARDLTWSHYSFLAMNRARTGKPEF